MNNRQLNGVSYPSREVEQNDRTATSAFYVQDQWTMGRVTLQGACVTTGHRAGRRPRAMARQRSRDSIPRRSLPAHGERGGYNDITPRLGAAWDVFGNGRPRSRPTGALTQNATNDENYTANNPTPGSRGTC